MTRAKHRTGARRHSGWWLLGIAMLIGALAAAAVGAARGLETGRGLVVIPVLTLLATPIILSARNLDRDDGSLAFDLGGIVFAGLAFKMLVAFTRFQMVDDLYNGVGDSSTYHAYGTRFAPQFRRFDFDVDPGLPIPGTGFIRVLTGIVYALFGIDRFTGFLIFGFMSFLGAWFFYRAFALALPDGNKRLYAVLMMFWPTLVFWPAAIGKEGWMILSLGLASWGAAWVYQRGTRGLPVLALGILGATMPRPHIAIVVLMAILTGLVMGSLFRSSDAMKSLGFASKVATAIFLLFLGSLLAPRVATFLNIDDVGGSGFTETLDEVARRTSSGGSNFTPTEIHSPLDYPEAFVTVLLRPFWFEAENAQAKLSALEGMVLAALLLFSLKQLLALPLHLVKKPYVAYAFAFAFMFVYVFAFIGNFGILTRQRSQLLPFVFVLVAVSTPRTSVLEAKFKRSPTYRAPDRDTSVFDLDGLNIDLRDHPDALPEPPRPRTPQLARPRDKS